MNDGIGTVAQPRKSSGIGEIACNPFNVFAIGLRAAGKCANRLFDLRCDIEHGLSDKAGGAGKRNGHIRTM